MYLGRSGPSGHGRSKSEAAEVAQPPSGISGLATAKSRKHRSSSPGIRRGGALSNPGGGTACVGPTRASLLPRARRTLACQQGFRGGGVRRGWARGRRVERTPPNRVGPPPKGRVGRAGRSEWSESLSDGGVEAGHLRARDLGAGNRACGLLAAAARQGNILHAREANLRALRRPVVPLRMVRAVLGRAVLARAAAAADRRRLVGNVIPSCASWCQSCSTTPSGPTTGSC